MPRRVLVLTPWVPYPPTGACQQDRFHGLRQMRHLGYQVEVIAKIHAFQPQEEIHHAFEQAGIPLQLCPYVRQRWKLVLHNLPRFLTSIAYADGAALEYTDPAYQKMVCDTVERFKPDVIWIEYSLLWPLLRLLRPYGIPMIVKSSINEPRNCVAENGGTLLYRLKAIPKYASERIAARESDRILAITPEEEEWYKSLGAARAGVLPLRGLSQCFRRPQHTEKDVLDVVFLSSNYSMGHNRDAALFLLREVIPLLRTRAPGAFCFHLTGKKFPADWNRYMGDDVRLVGFVPDLGAFLAGMDIAVSPWISGHGMQQKVFEPLCRGLPLITHKTAGYPFHDGEHVLLGQTAEDYVEHLMALRSAPRRQKLAEAAYARAQELFSQEAVERIVREAIESVLR